MKKVQLSLLSLFIASSVSFSQPVTDGLIGYWPFNGNANDESGNGNDGTVNGATLANDRHGEPGKAYYFSNDDFIEIPDIGSHSTFTFSVWVKVNEPQDFWNVIIEYGNRRGGINFVDGTTEVKFFMQNNNKEKISSDFYYINQNEWYHLALTIDWINSLEAKFYVNGILMETVGLFGVEKDGTSINIGKEDGRDYFLNGFVDDVSIYNRDLTEAEISNLYSGSNSVTNCAWSCLDDNLYFNEGSIGIGTNNTRGYTLAVAGGIIAEKVKVALQENWPDYVFDPNYQLNDLAELENFIIQNRHLPNMPKAKTVEKEGFELAEMDAKLLEKVEELTLYIIQQHKEIQALKKEIEELKE